MAPPDAHGPPAVGLKKCDDLSYSHILLHQFTSIRPGGVGPDGVSLGTADVAENLGNSTLAAPHICH